MADRREAAARASLSTVAAVSDETFWLVGKLLGSSSLELDGAMLAIASACGGCDTAAVVGQLDAAARTLFGCASLDCQDQAERLAFTLSGALGLLLESADTDGLLVDRALSRRRIHPVLFAAIGCEIGRRAGFHTALCESSRGWWTAVTVDGRTALIGEPGVAPEELDSVRAVCAHRLAFVILQLLTRDRGSAHAFAAERLLASLPDCRDFGDGEPDHPGRRPC
jgi:hypothetical protein